MPHHQTYIAGARFRRPASEAVLHLPVGAELALEAEPSNKFDPNAVKVLLNGIHVGFIPNDGTSAAVAALLAEGRVTACTKANRGDWAIDVAFTEAAA